MGIPQLWQTLRQAGVVFDLSGKENEVEIAKTVDGLAIAVDVTIWILQANLQPNMAEVFTNPTSRALKICFDRVSSSSWLLWYRMRAAREELAFWGRVIGCLLLMSRLRKVALSAAHERQQVGLVSFYSDGDWRCAEIDLSKIGFQDAECSRKCLAQSGFY